MNQRVVQLPNGDFEVLNADGSVQGMPQKVYPASAPQSKEALTPIRSRGA
jgi:hypothetical protein